MMNQNKPSKMKGVGAFVAAAIVVGIVLVSSLIITQQIFPEMKRSETLRSLEKGKDTMSNLDALVQELIFESTGAQREFTLEAKKGKFSISSDEDEIKYILEQDFPLYEQGTKIKEGNLIIAAGPFIKSYEKDINNNGQMDLVLENEELLFAIKKIGNKDSYQPINTSNIISLIRVKSTGREWTPESGIYIDELPKSSYGNGYTKLTKTGERLVSSSILVYLNSSSGWKYDALFTLQGGADFIDFRVKMK